MEKSVKADKVNLDISLCIICQSIKPEELVKKPTKHEKVLSSLEEWAKYGHVDYTEAWLKLKGKSLGEIERATSWHPLCYKDVVHIGMLKRAKERYERELAGPNKSRRKSSDAGVTNTQLTRSKTSPYNKEVCFFCDRPAGYRQPLHNVCTLSAGASLSSAVDLSGNLKLSVKLNTAIASNDAHSVDIKYHLKCWLSNVTNVLHKSRLATADSRSKLAGEIAAKIEFLTVTELTLRDGEIVAMSELQDAFESILEANNASNQTVSRKFVKQLLLDEMPDIEFHRPKRVNQSERVSIKTTRDAAIQLTEEQSAGDVNEDLETLFDAATVLRRLIRKRTAWKFTGSLVDMSDETLPPELYSFFRWVIQGPSNILSVGKKSQEVHKRAMSLAQTTISMCLSDRQAAYNKSQDLRSSSEMPQQLAVGLAVHQAVRSKDLINMLYGFGMSVDYNRILRVEAAIEASVLSRMALNDGVFLPPDVIKDRYVFFAIDNVDFAEDTPDGKRTLHGTGMAVYQRRETADKQPQLAIDAIADQRRTIKDLPESLTELMECPAPPKKPIGKVYSQFGLFSAHELPIQVRKEDFAWLLGRCLSRCARENLPVENASEPGNQLTRSTDVPVWSGYNALVTDVMPTTRVGSPPLIAAPAHEWQTLLTVLMQAQKINTKVVGPDRKTVISLDLGLYQPAKKLQMTRQDLRHLILRPGELHVVMAQVRTIGSYIENSGLDMLWIESDLYGPTTVKQVIDGKHVKRGETAHLVTLQALFELYQETFFQEHPDLKQDIEKSIEQLSDACAEDGMSQVKTRHEELMESISLAEIVQKMKAFDEKRGNRPMFTFVRQYMKMVMEMMTFIRAVRTGNWALHLTALELFAKYFFAHDMLNYARMIPLYLADMKGLPQSDPAIYHEFQQGNWVVNKNGTVPFCAVGADNALEHVNRSMKVSGGLVGITLNPCARTKYFLIAPELAKLAQEAREMAGTSADPQTRHHNLTTAVRLRQERNIEQLVSSLRRFTNPFTEESQDLYNLVTKVVLPEKVTKDLVDQSLIGKKLLDTFTNERIKSAKYSIWATMKKRKLLTWKSTGKTVHVAATNRIIELKEDRSLFAQMMVVCKSRPEINIKEAIGDYEFTVVPRSMFAADGSMLHCSSKSVLMDILEKLPGQSNIGITEQNDHTGTAAGRAQMRVVIVDGMAEVQALDKPDWIKSCSHLADHFTATIFNKYHDADELRLIFDRYDIPLSLKTATRVSRQGGQDPVSYRITDSTQINKVPMKRLLAHVNTKKELTEYLTIKTLEKGRQEGLRVTVAWDSKCKGTHRDMQYLDSNQEEADTKLLLHAVDATASGATRIDIVSPDTDMFVLALRRHADLCEDTRFVTGRGQRYRKIPLSSIVRALGPARTAALPGFHAWSGADVTGSFAGKGKLACWKAFLEADSDCVDALVDLGGTSQPLPSTLAAIEKLVCLLYLPGTQISSVRELRWCLFRRKQAESERLPPTKAALKEAIMRAHYQAMIWKSDIIPNPELPTPAGYGWTLEKDEWHPVMTQQRPAPDAVLHLIKCRCTKGCGTNRCQCRKAGLNCTDLCACGDDDEPCVNCPSDPSSDPSSDEEDDEEDT